MNDILSDEKEKSRTPEEKAMSRLQNWLICDDRPCLWSGSPNPNGNLPWSEVVCILAGIDPEASGDANASGLAFLPGALESFGFKGGLPRDSADMMALNAGVAEQIGLLIGFRLTTMSPRDAIAKVHKAGFTIPWLDLALKDPLCEPHLPRGISLASGMAQRTPASVSNRKKRIRQLETDDKQKFIEGVGRDEFNTLNANNFAGLWKKSGKLNVSAVARKLAIAIEKASGGDPDVVPKSLRVLINRVEKWRAK